VIGYGNSVGPAFGGPLAGQKLAPISEIANKPLRLEQRVRKVDDGAGGLVDQTIKFPVWFDAVADGSTPMCEALKLGHKVITEFIAKVPNCFPPLMVNITDGEANDGNPERPAAELGAIQTTDGPVLLFNVHLSSIRSKPIEFPDGESELPDDYAKMLFRMSSALPARMSEVASKEGLKITANSRGFVFNADLVSVIRFLDIGTRVDAKNLR
jgi:hypothetical protein